jgi:hypothetical protein
MVGIRHARHPLATADSGHYAQYYLKPAAFAVPGISETPSLSVQANTNYRLMSSATRFP